MEKLSTYFAKFYCCFDADEAGDIGARKFLKSAQEYGLDAVRLRPPHGKDVGDLNRDEFESLYSEVPGVLVI
jgi:DNA primase